MGTQTTGGGSTTSFTNTPQAKDDNYYYLEDWLRSSTLYNIATRTVTLDVMSNDLGGNAKSLFSIDDGNGNVLAPDYELLAKDVNAAGCSAWEKTPDGNWIRINSGKIEFKLGNPLAPNDHNQALDINTLSAGECVDDEFVYAIRLGNGTLSQATVRIHITGENDAVTLGAVTDVTITDTSANDTFADIVGTLTSTDPDINDTPTYGLTGSVASNLAGYDLMKVTAYGTLYLNSASGAYRFVANDAAIEGLDSDDPNVLLDFGVSVTDGDTTASDTLTITLDGANDAVELAAVTDVTITDTSANDTFADVTGTLVGSDRDAGETLVYGLTGSVASNLAGYDLMKVTAYGTLYLNSASGAYRFVANDAAIEGLDSDDPNVLLDFGVSVTDGDTTASDTLTITLDGANDAVELAAVTDVTITDTSANDTFADVTGTLVGSDRDAGETLVYGLTGSVASNLAGYDLMKVTAYGTLYLNSASGAYRFVANDAAIEGLDSDDPNVLLDFGVSVTDGDTTASDTLTITLDGANDAVELAAVTDVTITDTSANDTFADVTGTLVGSDRDAGETLVYGLTGSVASNLAGYDLMKVTAYGTLYLNSASGAYRFVANDAAIEGLDSDDPNVLLDFGVSVTDGDTTASDTLTITLDGANDAPEVANAIADQSVNEDNAWLYQFPANTFSDRDAGETLVYSATLDGGAPLPPWLSFDPDTRTFSGTPPQDFNGTVDITVTASDGDLTVSDTFTLTVSAVNDKPVNTIAGYSATEDTPKQLTGLAVADVDAGSGAIKVTLSVTSGVLTATTGGGVTVAGSGTGSIDLTGTLAAINAFLAAASAPVFTPAANANGNVTLTMTTTDNGFTGLGGSQTDTDSVTIAVAAVNDAAVITGSDTGTITEDAVPNTVTGDLNSTDVDGVNDAWTPQTTLSSNGYGTLMFNANGTWSYALNNGNATVNALNNGSTPLTDTFTVQTTDGTTHDIVITINGHTDAFVYTSPAPYTLGGDPNDFDSLGNPAGQIINGTNVGETLYGGAGADTIFGNNGDDVIYGGSGDDSLSGENQGDTLYGGSGKDTLIGGNQNDLLIGGYDADTLTGGNGSDTFFYFGQRDTGDRITDFTQSQDKIKFDTAFGFDATDFAGALATAGAVDPGKFGYKFDAGTNTTTIYVDTDGIFGADMEIKLTGNIALNSGDFLFGGP